MSGLFLVAVPLGVIYAGIAARPKGSGAALALVMWLIALRSIATSLGQWLLRLPKTS